MFESMPRVKFSGGQEGAELKAARREIGSVYQLAARRENIPPIDVRAHKPVIETTSVERFSLSLKYGQPGLFGERAYAERK